MTCDDGVNCTEGDICSGGACNGTAVQCNDDITCTPDTCDETTGECQSDATQCECQTDADCDDGNPCTDEFCCTGDGCSSGEALTCIRSNNTDSCDDGLFCNGPDSCNGGTCSVHEGDPCAGGGQCNQECNEGANNCFDVSGVACADEDDLTITECNGSGGCITVGTLQIEGTGVGCSLHPQAKGKAVWTLLNQSLP